MKKIRAWVFAVLMAVVLCACGEEQEQELADISTVEGDGYVAIIWEERTYGRIRMTEGPQVRFFEGG